MFLVVIQLALKLLKMKGCTIGCCVPANKNARVCRKHVEISIHIDTSRDGIQAVWPYMHYLLPKLPRSGRTAPSCSKRCNYIKQGVLSKRIQPNLVKNMPNVVTLDTRWDDFDVLKYVTRLKRKFTPPVKKRRCWLLRFRSWTYIIPYLKT